MHLQHGVKAREQRKHVLAQFPKHLGFGICPFPVVDPIDDPPQHLRVSDTVFLDLDKLGFTSGVNSNGSNFSSAAVALARKYTMA